MFSIIKQFKNTKSFKLAVRFLSTSNEDCNESIKTKFNDNSSKTTEDFPIKADWFKKLTGSKKTTQNGLREEQSLFNSNQSREEKKEIINNVWENEKLKGLDNQMV